MTHHARCDCWEARHQAIARAAEDLCREIIELDMYSLIEVELKAVGLRRLLRDDPDYKPDSWP